MVSKKMETELNKQINREIYSAYLYRAMACFFEEKNLKGFAHWLKMQAKEEMEHAEKIYDFIWDRGGKVIYEAIQAPQTVWKNPLEIFTKAYEHEQFVTSSIHALYDLSLQEKDHASAVFLQWFIDEQVEEEKNADEIVNYLKMIGDSANGLYMLDHQVGKRSKE